MRWIPDDTGRFPARPFFEAEELDDECEKLIASFLVEKHHVVEYPISIDDLTVLIEQHTSDLDLYADLSSEGNDVEGVTDFLPDAKPKVRISQELQDPRRENRLRTTLTHELGHVKFHNGLWRHAQMSLFDHPQTCGQLLRCKRETILTVNRVDWMEWQAGYVSGAMLMPITPLLRIVQDLFEENNVVGSVLATSYLGQELIRQVQAIFQVSADAARVRLLQLGYLTDRPNISGLLIPF